MRSGCLALVLSLAGCASTPGPDWAARAEQADRAGLWMASISALLVVPGNLDPRATPTYTARDAVRMEFVPFAPYGCAVATSRYGTVSYTLDHCMGSFGLVEASGHLEVEYFDATPTGDLVFDARTDDLVLNGEPVAFDAHAVVGHDTANAVRTITLQITSSGVGLDGAMLTRSGTQTGRWFDGWGCLFVDEGEDTLQVDEATWQMRTGALSYCIGECPMTGGIVEWSGPDGTLTLRYGGAAEGEWSVGAAGGIVPVSCRI